MAKKKSSYLYKASRKIGKAASVLNDIETLATGDPEKIAKRAVRKNVYKSANKGARKVSNKIR